MSFLALVTSTSGCALVVLDDELHLDAAEFAVVLVQIHLEAVDHVGAELREDAGARRQETDVQLLRARRRSGEQHGNGTSGAKVRVNACVMMFSPFGRRPF